MRVVAGFGFFFFLSGISALAQTAPPAGTSNVIRPGAMNTVCGTKMAPADPKQAHGGTATTCVTLFVPGCPIDMRVHQRMGGDMVAVDANGVKRHVFAQRLRLFLNDLRPVEADRKIVSATVTVHGSGGKARVAPVGADSIVTVGPGSIQRTLTVGLTSWGEPGVSGDFGLPGFTSASRVDLESVTYSDGSVWKLSGNETCRVAPDPMMLINH